MEELWLKHHFKNQDCPLGRDSEPNLTSTLTQNVKIRDLSIVCGKINNFWLNLSQSTKLWLNKQFVVKPARKMYVIGFHYSSLCPHFGTLN